MTRDLNRRGTILPQDSGLDADLNDLGIPEALSQAEIDELLNSDERPAEERLDRLLEFRDELVGRASADVADHDARSLLREVQNAIVELRGMIEERDSEDEDFVGFDATTDLDPADHSEVLSPDDDERAEREDEEMESLEDDLGEELVIEIEVEEERKLNGKARH